jgi:hypothetical protein
LTQLAPRRDQAVEERQRPRLGNVAAHRGKDRVAFAGIEMQVIDGAVHRQTLRRRIERQGGAPQPGVEPAIAEHDLIVAAQFGGGAAAPVALGAAHLEQVGEVVLEQDADLQLDRLIAVIAKAQPLIGGAAPQEHRAQNVHVVLFQEDALIGDDVRIGQVDEQRRIVVAQIGAEQKRRHAVHEDFEAGQIARVEVKQAGGSPRSGGDVVFTAVPNGSRCPARSTDEQPALPAGLTV